MPVVQDISAKEASELAYLTAIGEISDGTYKGLDVLLFEPKGRSGYFYKAKKIKEKIVLHFTIGYLGGDLSKLTKNDFHVSVPFVIANSGQIVQLFDPDYWSYHLTRQAVGGNEYNSARSVAIEMSNLGPLEKKGAWMWNYYGSKYCRASETQFYTDLGAEYRGYRFYTTFTDAQYVSLNALLNVLSEEYGIPKTFLGLDRRFGLFPSAADARDYRGICSHVNFQPPTVKTDIGPAFDWAKIGG